MRIILTFVADKSRFALTPSFMSELTEALSTIPELVVKACEQLSEEKAYDIQADYQGSLLSLYEPVRSILGAKPVDVIIQEALRRQKKVFAADMDGTMIEQECIDELAELAGKRSEVARITEAAMQGELNFEQALKQRVKCLKGLPETIYDQIHQERITFSKGSATLVATLKKQGIHTMLISGGFQPIALKVGKTLGFDEMIANRIVAKDGLLTSELEKPLINKQRKKKLLVNYLDAHSLSIGDSIAVGDGANDLPMLLTAGLGVGYYAKAVITKVIPHQIQYTDLTTLLYALGYPDSDISFKD